MVVVELLTGCGGECCGITHKFRVNWADRPKFHYRVEFSRDILRKIATEHPDKFTSQDVYELIHREHYSRPEIAQLSWPERIKSCPTYPWDIHITDWLHTNGYIAVVKRYPGGVQSPFVITELGRELIAGT